MKNKVNFVLDLVLLVLMSSITGIGLLIKYVLLPGKERNIAYGRDVDLYLLGWDRHEWGVLHLWIGYALVALVLLHIFLHWKQICFMASGLLAHRVLKNGLALLFAVFCILLVAWPFLVPVEVKERRDRKSVV